MEKTKLLTISVIGLLLLNLGTLGFLFMNGTKEQRLPHNRPGGRPSPREIIIHKLHFDTNQQKEYDKIIDWHRGEIRQLEKKIHEAKDKLYSELIQPKVNVKTKDSLMTLLASYQKQIEETHFKHFSGIKMICHPNQMVYYNELTEELSRLFSRSKPPIPRHD